MPTWNISILPRFEIRTEAGQIVSLRSRQYAELLAILTLAGPQGVDLASIGSDFFSEEWSDHKKALRNVLSRTKRHLESYSDVPLVKREEDFISLDPAQCQCDLWSLIEELDRSASLQNHDRIEQILSTINPPLIPEQFVSSITQSFSSRRAQDLLRGVEILAAESHRPGLRALATKVLGAIKSALPYSTDTIQRQLAIFGKLRMRQEIIETLADYTEFLDEDLGDAPGRQLESFAERLLSEIDRSDIDSFAIPRPPHYYLNGIAPIADFLEVVREHKTVFVGGLPGVGKSQLMIETALSSSFPQGQLAFIDLREIARPLPLAQLVPRNPKLILIDHYAEPDLQIVRNLQQVFPDSKIVVAGPSDSGLDFEAQFTVKPLRVGSETSDAEAERLVKHLLVSRPQASSIVHQLATVSQGIPAAIIKLAGLANEFGAELAIHTFATIGSLSGAGVLNRDELLDQLQSLSTASLALLKALTGLRCPISTILAVTCFQLGIDEIRHLVSLGLIEINRDQETVEIPMAASEALRGLAAYGPGNDSQILLELTLYQKLNQQAPAEANIFDVEALQVAIDAHTSRDDYRGALKLLRVLRPYLFIIRSCKCSVDGLADHLFDLDLSPDDCIDALLSVGAALFYQFRHADAVSTLSDRRWDSKREAAPDARQAEFYSQLGIVTALAGDKWKGIEALELAAKIAAKPGLEHIRVKAYYNLAATYFRVGELQLVLENMSRAVSLLRFVPTTSGRLELLHMQANYSYEAGVDLQTVKERFLVAMTYARSNGLHADAGWILGSLGARLIKEGHSLAGVVVLTASIRDELASNLTPEFKKRCSFNLDLIAHGLLNMGNSALAYQSALLALNLFSDYYSREDGFKRMGIKPIELPEGLKQASEPATGGDILVFLSRVQQITRQFPEAARVLKEFGYLEETGEIEPEGMYTEPNWEQNTMHSSLPSKD